jgi:hypothetical protein
MANSELFLQVVIIGILVVAVYMYLANKDSIDLKCVISTVDGNKYCVRDRTQVAQAADLLASVVEKCKKLVEYLYEKYPTQDNVIRLHEGFNPLKIMETLPTSEHTAYSENKGEKLAFCLNKKNEDNSVLIDENTLAFVALHELAHVATKSIGHKSEFWDNFRFLLTEAKEAGLHNPQDYSKSPQEYCGMKITDNPYYDA